MNQTAHERYEEAVKNGVWRPYDDAQMAAKQRQFEGLRAERDALAAALAAKTEQVAGLLDERQVLRAQRATLSAVIARITEYPVLSSAHTDGAATWLLTCSQADLQTLQLAGGSNAKTG